MSDEAKVTEHGRCPDCGTELTSVKGRRSGKHFLWCWKCERSMRPAERRLASVPDPTPIEDPYGWVEFLADTSRPPIRLTVGVVYGDDDPGTDIALSPSGYVVRHPYDTPRESTEDERAAVGWTW